MDKLPVSTGNLRSSIDTYLPTKPWVSPPLGEMKRRLRKRLKEMMRDLNSGVMRRTAEVDADLHRTAVIRALENPS